MVRAANVRFGKYIGRAIYLWLDDKECVRQDLTDERFYETSGYNTFLEQAFYKYPDLIDYVWERLSPFLRKSIPAEFQPGTRSVSVGNVIYNYTYRDYPKSKRGVSVQDGYKRLNSAYLDKDESPIRHEESTLALPENTLSRIYDSETDSDDEDYQPSESEDESDYEDEDDNEEEYEDEEYEDDDIEDGTTNSVEEDDIIDDDILDENIVEDDVDESILDDDFIDYNTYIEPIQDEVKCESTRRVRNKKRRVITDSSDEEDNDVRNNNNDNSNVVYEYADNVIHNDDSDGLESYIKSEEDEDEDEDLGDGVYYISRVIDYRYNSELSTIQYLVKWKNFPSTDNSWITQEDFISLDMVREFWKRQDRLD